jgi:hypothetical protein
MTIMIDYTQEELEKIVEEEEVQFEIWTDLLDYVGTTHGATAVRALVAAALSKEGQDFVRGYIDDHCCEEDDEYFVPDNEPVNQFHWPPEEDCCE